MSSQRIENLKQILAADPDDTFARYALGLEYISSGEVNTAIEIFEEVKTLDPSYTAVYYQLGKAYELNGDEQSARKIYEKGVYVAASQNDHHTKEELEQAINDLL